MLMLRAWMEPLSPARPLSFAAIKFATVNSKEREQGGKLTAPWSTQVQALYRKASASVSP